MPQQASITLKIIYCLAVIGIVFPFSVSGLFRMTLAGFSANTFLAIGPLLLLALGLYRIYWVVTTREALTLLPVSGFLWLLRYLGIALMTIGAIMIIVRPFMGLVALVVFGWPKDGVIAPFMGGVFFAVAGLAPLGVVLFESSRLMAFERESRSGS